MQCCSGTETALHNVVRRRESALAARLLAAGANPNLVIYSSSPSSPTRTDTGKPDASDGQKCDFYFKGSTCLVEACKNRDLPMIDLLLKYSARYDKTFLLLDKLFTTDLIYQG